MIFVFEGTDCAGKTTVVDTLCEGLVKRSLGVTRLKRGPLRDDPLTEYLVPLEEAYTGQHMVMDRWHVGELIYGPRRRGESKLSLGQALYIENVMSAIGGPRIVVTARCDILRKRYEQRGDPITTIGELCEIQNAFIDYAHSVTTWQRMDADFAHERVNIWLDMNDVYPSQELLPSWYVGPYFPEVLLLGDVRNPLDRHTPLPWPFVPWPATSGKWMFDALANVDARRTLQVGLLNACERSEEELRRFWATLACPPVVAMGNNAFDAARRAKLPIEAKTQHPQYWRRFRHSHHVEFADIIFGVMK